MFFLVDVNSCDCGLGFTGDYRPWCCTWKRAHAGTMRKHDLCDEKSDLCDEKSDLCDEKSDL